MPHQKVHKHSLSESETLLANFAANSVVSIDVFLANIAPGRWPDQKWLDYWHLGGGRKQNMKNKE